MYSCPHCDRELRLRDIAPEFSCPGCGRALQSTQKRSALIVALMFTMFALFGGPSGFLYVCANLKCLFGLLAFCVVLLIMCYVYLIRVAPAGDTDV